MTSYAQRHADSLARPAVDLRHLLASPVRHQGPRPLCVPFSIAAAHEATRVQMGEPGAEMLAVEPLWQHCLDNGQAGHGGTTLTAGREAVQAKGQTAEAWWPYNDTLGAGTEPEPAAATQAAWYKAVTVDTPLAHDGIEDLIEDAPRGGPPPRPGHRAHPRFRARQRPTARSHSRHSPRRWATTTPSWLSGRPRAPTGRAVDCSSATRGDRAGEQEGTAGCHSITSSPSPCRRPRSTQHHWQQHQPERERDHRWT